jgi:hypothetical protein
MNLPDDYCPIGLGRTLEDLIDKHAANLSKESPYQWAIRTAAQTRALLAKTQPKPVESSITEPPKNATGKTAYEWAFANGKSTIEASKLCGVSQYSIKAHRSYYNLPSLVDGRINSAERRRVRRSPELLKEICKTARADMKRIGSTITATCRKHGIDQKTFQAYILSIRKTK